MAFGTRASVTGHESGTGGATAAGAKAARKAAGQRGQAYRGEERQVALLGDRLVAEQVRLAARVGRVDVLREVAGREIDTAAAGGGGRFRRQR